MKTWILTLLGVLTSFSSFAQTAAFTISTSATQLSSNPRPLPDDGIPDSRNHGANYSYNFGQVPVNSSRWAQFTLTSTGTAPLYINAINLYGQSYYARSNCPRVLNPGWSCQTNIEFTPWFDGYFDGQLAFYTSAGTFIINLYGWGVRW